MAKLFLLFCAFVPVIYAQCSVEKAKPLLKRAVYEFSIDLLTRIGQEKDYHFVTSPLSAWTLLSVASLGAADKTLSEMSQVLHLHAHKCFNYKYLEIAKNVSSINEMDVFLERSSVIFADSTMSLLETYVDKVLTTHVSSIERVPFNNVDETAATINDYVSRATHETVDEIVNAGDLEDTRVVMIDALFFKGSWFKKFDDVNTEQSAFYDHLGNQKGDVNLMFQQDEFNVASINQVKADVLELPYGENKRYSMLIFLPFQGVPLSTMIDNLERVSLTSIRNLLIRRGPISAAVQIPRFKITSDLSNLKELLIDMGLSSAFDEREASFPKMSEEQLYISTFIQKADIEVTEDGTTASAATSAGFSSRMGPTPFNANKPFVFMIIDNKTEIPIFAGAFSKPSSF